MPRLDKDLPVAVFNGGPLDGTTMVKAAGGRWADYRDREGKHLRADRGGRTGARRGGVYQRQPKPAGRPHPVGSRVYRWIPPKGQTS